MRLQIQPSPRCPRRAAPLDLLENTFYKPNRVLDHDQFYVRVNT
ncbi:hypothetical protein [Micromonospora sp. CA-111912]